MNTTIEKIIHHFAFSIFWGLIVMIIVLIGLQLIQWNNSQIINCEDRGYSLEQCIKN